MKNSIDPKELFKEAAATTDFKYQKITADPFNKSGKIISAKQLNADKFLTYDSETYGKLGFDPSKDNDKLYNTNTHSSADIGRAWDGMWKLAGVGFQDTFGFGVTAGKDNWKNFENVMNQYSSSRGGYTQFWANTMLSSGYTIGIIGAIAAEEFALAATTGGLGNLSSAGLVGTQLGKAFSRMGKAPTAATTLERVEELSHIGNATKWYNTLGSKVVKGLNPIGESLDFYKTVGKMDHLNSWQKLATGAGAIARDARKIYMTHSESNMEAEMARSEFIERQIEEAYKKSKGSPVSDKEFARIQLNADNVFQSTYKGNLGLIYATNAITFDNMFKSMRFNAKMFDLPKNAFKVSRTTAGKVKVNVNKDLLRNSLKQSLTSPIKFAKKKLNEVTVASAIKGTLSSSVEGFQELGQDVISNSVKKYYGRNHVGQQVRGGYFDYLYHDVGSAISESMNADGGATFMSGFLMGSFAAPFGSAMRIAHTEILGGGIRSKAQYMYDRQAWANQQKTKYKEALAKAQVLTEVFNENLNYLKHATNPMFAQSELQEEILSAAQDNDKKKFEDAKHESFQNGIRTMLKNNMEGEFADLLTEMSTQYTAENLNQALGRSDINDSNIGKHKEKLAKQAEDIKHYRKLYDEIEDTIINPIKQSEIDQLDITDSEQREKKLGLIIKQQAFENLKNELLFSHGKIANKAYRMKELEKVLNADSELSSTEVQSLISQTGINNELKLLKAHVEANKQLKLTGEDLKESKKIADKLEALNAYKVALDKLEKVQNDENGTASDLENAHNDLFNAYHKYRTTSSKEYGLGLTPKLKKNKSKESFKVLSDYLTLNLEHEKLQEVVNTLLDPNSATDWVDKNSKMLSDLEKNKEKHIENQLKAYLRKAESSKMLTELQTNNLFFELDELDDLVKKGIMPSVIYDIETGKPVTGEKFKIAQDIISSFYTKLTGKRITNSKASANEKTSARSKNDKRTTKTLIRQYNLKMNQVIDLSEGESLDKLVRLLKASKQLTFLEKEILDVVSESTPKIMFTQSAELPISINEDGVFVIDIRYAGADYKNAAVSFETLVISALTQNKAAESLNQNEAIKAEVEILMQQAKAEFDKKHRGSEAMPMFSDPALFLSEALNNVAVQTFLKNIVDTTSPTKKSVWTSLVSKLTMLFKKSFDQTLLQRAIDLAKITLDQKTLDNINEPADSISEPSAEIETEEASVDEVTTTSNVTYADVSKKQEEVDALNKIREDLLNKLEKEGLTTDEILENEEFLTARDNWKKASDEYDEIFSNYKKSVEEGNKEYDKNLKAHNLQLEIQDKKALVSEIDLELASLGRLSFRKRISLNNKRLVLLDEINTLQEEYDIEFAGISPTAETNDTVDETAEVETEVVTNESGDLVITEKTKFDVLPVDLQKELTDFYKNNLSLEELRELRAYFKKDIVWLEANYMKAHGNINGAVDAQVKETWDKKFEEVNQGLGNNFKLTVFNGLIKLEYIDDLKNLTSEDIKNIEKSLATDYDYQMILINYNKRKEEEASNLLPSAQQEEEEEDPVISIQPTVDAKMNSRARRRARKAGKQSISAMEREDVIELLKKVFKSDFDLLTKNELNRLVDNLVSDSNTFTFGIPDAIAFMNKKKLSSSKKANNSLKAMLEFDGSQSTIFDSIESNNIDLLWSTVNSKKQVTTTYLDKSVKLSLNKSELECLLMFHANLFKAEDTTTLFKNIYAQKKLIDASANSFKTEALNTDSPAELEQSVIDLFLKAQNSGMLFPSTVRALNNNFIKSGSKLTIVKSKSAINGVYALEARDRKLNDQPVTSYKANLNTVREYIDSAVGDDLLADAIIADWFSRSKENRLHPDFISKNIVKGVSEVSSRKNLLSSKSTIKTADGLGNLIYENFADRFNPDFSWQNAINNFISKYSSLKEMMEGVSSEIKSLSNSDLDMFGRSEAENDELQRLDEERLAQEKSDKNQSDDWFEFIRTDSGERLLDSLGEYYNSFEFKLENGLVDVASLDYNSLTENQKNIFDRAVNDGVYDKSELPAEDITERVEKVKRESFDEALANERLKETNLQKEMDAFFGVNFNLQSSYDQVAKILKALQNPGVNFDNLALFLGMYQYIAKRFYGINDSQLSVLLPKFIQKLDTGFFIGQSVIIDESAFQVLGYNKKNQTVELANLDSGEVVNISYNQFFNASDSLLPGKTFTKLNIDTVVNDQEIEYIKTTYRDIFNNFTASTLEFDKLDTAEINNKILEELTKCK